jgi:hypothetical protein
VEACTCRTPVGEPCADREASREDGVEVRWESEAELSFGSSEFRIGQTGLDLDTRIAQMGYYFIS